MFSRFATICSWSLQPRERRSLDAVESVLASERATWSRERSSLQQALRDSEKEVLSLRADLQRERDRQIRGVSGVEKPVDNEKVGKKIFTMNMAFSQFISAKGAFNNTGTCIASLILGNTIRSVDHSVILFTYIIIQNQKGV